MCGTLFPATRAPSPQLFSARSFRYGGAIDLRLEGLTLDVLQRLGRWRSSNMLARTPCRPGTMCSASSPPAKCPRGAFDACPARAIFALLCVLFLSALAPHLGLLGLLQCGLRIAGRRRAGETPPGVKILVRAL
jgi:hypothetical protein